MHVSAMRTRNLAHDRKADPRAVRSSRHKRLEQAIPNGVWYSRPGIAHPQAKDAVILSGIERHRASCWRVLNTIEYQIVERAAHLVDIELRRLSSIGNGTNLEPNAIRSREFTMCLDKSGEELREARVLVGQTFLLGHRQEVA